MSKKYIVITGIIILTLVAAKNVSADQESQPDKPKKSHETRIAELKAERAAMIKKKLAKMKKAIEYKGLTAEQIEELEKNKKLQFENSLKTFKVFETPPPKNSDEIEKIFKKIRGRKYDISSYYLNYKHIPNYAKLKEVYLNSEEAQLLDAAFKLYIQRNPMSARAVLDKMKTTDKDPRFARIKLHSLSGEKVLPYLNELLKKDPENKYYLGLKKELLFSAEMHAYMKSRSPEKLKEYKKIGLSKELISTDNVLQKYKNKNSSRYKKYSEHKKRLVLYMKKYKIKPYTSEEVKKAERIWYSKSLIDIENRLLEASKNKNSLKYEFFLEQKKKVEASMKRYKIKPYTSKELKELKEKKSSNISECQGKECSITKIC